MRRLLERVARRDMGRLFIVVLPALTVAAAVLGALLDAPAPAAVLALLLGVAASGFVLAVVSTRAGQLAARVDQIGSGERVFEHVFEGREEWRELANAIDRVARVHQWQAEEVVAERVRSQRLVEELPSAVLVLEHTVPVYANRAARDLFALAPDSVTVDFVASGYDALLDAVKEVAAVGRTIDVELQRGERVLTARAAELDAAQLVLVVRDITRARRLDEVRRDFVVNASHELKTPVAGIQALADSLALALRQDPARATRMVVRIEHEAGRLARLVRDLLDLARLEEPDSPQQRRRVNVADVVRRQVERIEPLAAERGITIDVDMPAVVTMVAVAEDIRSIAANLLENAVRYNRDGGAVRVHLRRTGDRVTFAVADTGDGIAEQERDRIFERFYRIDKARSRAAGGTGLGLALVRHASQRHGGTVRLHSEVGVGSTFTVELPVTTE